ncbi:hypothetical protein [Amycolatopsis sp. NPDC004378]
MPSVKATSRIAAIAGGLALLLTACGEDTSTSTTPSSTAPQQSSNDPAAIEKCLKDKGIEMPSGGAVPSGMPSMPSRTATPTGVPGNLPSGAMPQMDEKSKQALKDCGVPVDQMPQGSGT